MILRSPSTIICFIIFISFTYEVGSVEVTLLTTEGVTTDLGWKVHNIDENGGFAGWEDMSLLFEQNVVRGYQVCQLTSDSNMDDKPESWLLIPGINVNGASRIFIEMNFTMRECSDLEKTCRETFSVFYRLADARDPDLSQFETFDADAYTKIDTVAAEVRFSKLSKPSKESWDSLMNLETVQIKLKESTENTVVHIAIVDVGACMALMGVRVYHRVCPEVVKGFAIFNKTMTGSSDTSLVPVSGNCVPFSTYPEPSSPSPDGITSDATSDPEMSDLIGPMYHCTSSGEWQVQTGECQCVAGYQPNKEGNGCEPCANGAHKPSLGDDKCSICPIHSNTATTGAKSCECDEGFYNIASVLNSETPTLSDIFDLTSTDNLFARNTNECNLCSRLPSPPRDLEVKQVHNGDPGSIQISWNRPVSNGGCHNIQFCIVCEASPRINESASEDVKDCSHLMYYPSRCHVNQQKVTISQLRGYVSYNFTIAAYSLVTAQRFSNALQYLNDESGETEHFRNESVVRNMEQIHELLEASSASLLHSTNATLPSSVGDVTLLFGNQTTIALKWKEPLYTNGKILYYEIKWSLVFEDNEGTDQPSETPEMFFTRRSDWNTLVVNETEATLTQLYPESLYDIIISAHNSAGSDNGSGILRASTLPIEELPEEETTPSHQPYLIATVVIAVLVVLICILLALQWKCRSRKKKHSKDNGVTNHQHAEFRPFNSHHESLEQRTYVDPFSLDSVSTHRFLCETSPESITCESVIGCGEFGEVYKGTLATIDLKTGQETTIEVAVKQLRDQCEPQEQVDFLREALSLQRFRHPNIVHLEAVVTTTRPFFIVTELMGHGSLHMYLTRLKEKADSENKGRGWIPPISHVVMAKMLKGVARGMEYLCGRGFVHRDLAARNVLVNTALKCKVADFGLTRELDSNDGENGGTICNGNNTYTTRGGKIAIRWTAPEAMAFRTFTQFSDVWSFGILMWEAASFAEKPYWDLTNHEVMKAVNDGFRLPAPDFCPLILHELMLDCWHQEHKCRPTFTTVIARLDQMISVPNVLRVPSSAAVSVDEDYFSDDVVNPCPPQGNPHILDEEVLEPLLTTVMVDRHNELTNQEDDEFELANRNGDGGSEVSSCTSTICASEVTVCAANNVAVYVPLHNSGGSRPESPFTMRQSPKIR